VGGLREAASGDDLVVGLRVLPREREKPCPRGCRRLSDRTHRVMTGGVLLLGKRQGRDHLGERGPHRAGDSGGSAAPGGRSRGSEVVEEVSEGGGGKIRHGEAPRTTRPPRMTAETRFTPQ